MVIMPKIIFGIHIAQKGAMVLFSATTFKTSKEKTKTKAIPTPIAKLIPIPPLLFSEVKDKAKIDKIKIETGIEVRW